MVKRTITLTSKYMRADGRGGGGRGAIHRLFNMMEFLKITLD